MDERAGKGILKVIGGKKMGWLGYVISALTYDPLSLSLILTHVIRFHSSSQESYHILLIVCKDVVCLCYDAD